MNSLIYFIILISILWREKKLSYFLPIAIIIFLAGFMVDNASTSIIYLTIGENLLETNDGDFFYEQNPNIREAIKENGIRGIWFNENTKNDYFSSYFKLVFFGFIFIFIRKINKIKYILLTPLFLLGMMKTLIGIANISALILHIII